MQNRKTPNPLPLMIALAFVLLPLEACTKNAFNINRESKTSSQSVVIQPDLKGHDRPTESGTGVPGYLVCSLFTVQDENVQVGCNTTDAQGAKVATGEGAWNRYDIRLPADAPLGVGINKSVASNLAVWDVNFNFTGGTKDVLSEAARRSTYGFVYTNAAGQTVRIETAQPAPPTPVTPPATTTCVGGALVDNVCFIPVEMSCSDYCAKSTMQPHPYLIDRFGAGNDTDDDTNKQACHDLYVKIRGNQDFRFGDTISVHGWGCFEEYDGRVVFDKEFTNLFEYPRIGDRRICGCI